jgi:hypothetical protein
MTGTEAEGPESAENDAILTAKPPEKIPVNFGFSQWRGKSGLHKGT